MRQYVFNMHESLSHMCECHVTIECVLLLQNVFSYKSLGHMCECHVTIECVLLLQNVFSYKSLGHV